MAREKILVQWINELKEQMDAPHPLFLPFVKRELLRWLVYSASEDHRHQQVPVPLITPEPDLNVPCWLKRSECAQNAEFHKRSCQLWCRFCVGGSNGGALVQFTLGLIRKSKITSFRRAKDMPKNKNELRKTSILHKHTISTKTRKPNTNTVQIHKANQWQLDRLTSTQLHRKPEVVFQISESLWYACTCQACDPNLCRQDDNFYTPKISYLDEANRKNRRNKTVLVDRAMKQWKDILTLKLINLLLVRNEMQTVTNRSCFPFLPANLHWIWFSAQSCFLL